jgi:hypothetical protein
LAFASPRNQAEPSTADDNTAVDLVEVLAEMQERSRMLVILEELIPGRRRRSQPVAVTIGSPESAVYRVFGEPEDVKQTATQWGVSKQLVYFGGALLIFTAEGVVTNWKDSVAATPP